MKLTVVILAFNEEIHIERCIKSAKLISDTIYVVDSFSTDKTRELAEELGAQCISREFDSHAAQFNWALGQIAPCEWVVRIDSDEYLTDQLVCSIKRCVSANDSKFNGYSFKRRIYFLGNAISYGGVFPVEVVRMFRYGFGRIENRLMDEHILVEGNAGVLCGEIIDDNKRSLAWWVDKHNRYSSLEALEMYFEEKKHSSQAKLSGATVFRRRLKTIYQKSPIYIRATLLFVYRYIVRLGFLDGFHGFIFHFYQGYWYRLLVDTKFYLLVKANINLNVAETAIHEASNILNIEREIVAAKISAKQKNAK